MADPNRKSTYRLIDEIAKAPYRYDFYAALRLFECANADRPRLGTSVKLADDPFRLAQEPELDFAPSTISKLTPGKDGRPPRIAVRFLGLFGPNGPLPLHLTEHARERIRHHGDATLVRFADIFHHRMLCLFYRAWANAQPTVSYDRPDEDRFIDYVGSLFGIGDPTLQKRDAMPDRAKLHFAGHLSSGPRHPDGLECILRGFFGLTARVVEFVGEWMDIARDDQTRLGLTPRTAALGMSAVVGASVWGCQHRFRVILGPLSLIQYQALLPGGQSLVELLAIVRNYAGDELAWDANLILRHDQVPDLRLDGGAQLGWTTWLGPRNTEQDAMDLRLNPFFRMAA